MIRICSAQEERPTMSGGGGACGRPPPRPHALWIPSCLTFRAAGHQVRGPASRRRWHHVGERSSNNIDRSVGQPARKQTSFYRQPIKAYVSKLAWAGREGGNVTLWKQGPLSISPQPPAAIFVYIPSNRLQRPTAACAKSGLRQLKV